MPGHCLHSRGPAPQECCFTYCFNTSSTRVCQPRPPALKKATTSGDRRKAVGTLRAAFCGPRLRRSAARVAVTPPPGVTMAWSQSTAVVGGLSSSGTGRAGAAASAASGSKGGKVASGFMFVGMAAGNQVGVVSAWGPDQDDDPPASLRQAFQALLAIGAAGVLGSHQRKIKGDFQHGQVNSMLAKV